MHTLLKKKSCRFLMVDSIYQNNEKTSNKCRFKNQYLLYMMISYFYRAFRRTEAYV